MSDLDVGEVGGGQCFPLFFSHLRVIFSFGKDCSYRRKAFGMSRMNCSEGKERMFSVHTLESLCGQQRGCRHSSNLPTRPSTFQNQTAIFSRVLIAVRDQGVNISFFAIR